MYSEFFKINKNFQTSINLELDLNNVNKLTEYIPTSDICDVLKKYLVTCFENSSDRATTLVGPYGKGKSFLLLVLTYILSNKPKTRIFNELLGRFKQVDEELYELIVKYQENGSRLLPIIINSNYGDLNQSFMLALNDALTREGITDVVPNTVYSVCVDIISKWESDKQLKEETLKVCTDKFKISLAQLKRDLENYSLDAYKKFEDLYNCVTRGLPFNPLVNNDVVKVYQDVNHALCERNYSGMFIVFDEFSKFIDNQETTLSKSLKIIQDLGEAATRSSKNEQLHLCCVTHKSVNLYGNTNDKADAFKAIEGRFKEIRFNRTLEGNYKLIAASVKRDDSTDEAKNLVDEYLNSHEEYYKEIEEFAPFASDVDVKKISEDCFPLNPVTVYSLIQLSELIAQNERTLFTFLSDTDDNSFNSFLHTQNKDLFNVDKIYDYFSELLKKEEGNDIRNLWYRTESTLAKVANPNQKKILKALAVILMINNPEQFAPDEQTLHLATSLSVEEVKANVNALIDDHLLRKNAINQLISFASSNSKAIEDQISLIIQTKQKTFSIEKTLDEVNESKYVLPRRYNAENKITRYYRVAFITEKQLRLLNSFDLIKEQNYSDGLILNLIRKEMSAEEIRERVDQIADPAVVLKYPAELIDSYYEDLVIRYSALNEILKHGGNDEIVTKEIELLLDETKEDIKALNEKYFETEYEYMSCVYDDRKYTHLLSDLMDYLYPKKIIFNNELINKNNVTVQYQKAANRIIDDVLNGVEGSYTETSPETTIRNSVINTIAEQEDVCAIIDDLKESIKNSEEKKLDIAEVVAKYTDVPYGIRKGILSILIAKAISDLESTNVILYFKNREIDLTASNIVKAVCSSGGYYLGSSKGSAQLDEFLSKQADVLNVQRTGNLRTDTKAVCNAYQKFFMGLPQIFRSAKENNEFGVSAEIIKYKNKFMSFNINPYELVFEEPKKLFKTDSYTKIRKELNGFIQKWEELLNDYKASVASKLKNELQISSETTLKMGLESILNKSDNEKVILTGTNKSIYDAISGVTFDDTAACNDLSYSALGGYIEDWSFDRSDELCTQMKSFIEMISEAKKIDTSSNSIDDILSLTSDVERSDMGRLLENSIDSAFDDFGESVSPEEKIAILSAMIQRLMNG